jgi:hypothetical protein
MVPLGIHPRGTITMLRYALFAAALAFALPAAAADTTTTPGTTEQGTGNAEPTNAGGGDPAVLIDELQKDISDKLEALKQALPTGAAAGGTGKMLEGVTADEMAAVIKDAGYKAEVKMDSNNEPYIDSKASGLNFWVYLYRCDGQPAKCLRIQFQSSFSTKKEHQDKALQWNVDKVVGRAYNIKDSTYFDYVIDTDGGVSSDNLMRNVELWDTLMGEFTKYIGW